MIEVFNRYIFTQYELKDRFEAGIILSGPEVKSCKLKTVNFKGAYCSFHTGNFYLKNFYIASYKPAQREQRGYDPYRIRTLLLHKKELLSIEMRSKVRGIAVIPIRMYTKRGFIKFEIALAQGLKKYDKREKIKERDEERRLRVSGFEQG